MRSLHCMVALVICALCSLSAFGRVLHDSTTLSRFGIGITGGGIVNVGSGEPSSGAALRGIEGIEFFPVPLNRTTALSGFSIGVLADYRLSVAWSLELRADYTRQQTTLTGDEQVIISLWNVQRNRYTPLPVTLRNTLTLAPQAVGITPRVRLHLGEFLFVSGGIRFDALLPTIPDYSLELTQLPPNASLVAFDSTGVQRLALPLVLRPAAQQSVSISPVASLGAMFSIGERVRILPEITWQPVFQPFRAITVEGRDWNIGSVRLSCAFMLDIPAAQTVPPTDTTPSFQQQAVPTVSPVVLSSTASLQRQAIDSSNYSSNYGSKADGETVLLRDTIISVVAWNLPDTVRLVERTGTNATTDTTFEGQLQRDTLMESYIHEMPKARPFLVPTLGVRFVPAVGSPRRAETIQLSRLRERLSVVRRLRLDVRTSAVLETVDTLHSVRFPVMRFLPAVSSEVGIDSDHFFLTIVAEKQRDSSQDSPMYRHVESLQTDGQTALDWDAQLAVLQADTTLSPDDKLLVWLTVRDVEGQERMSDTVQIVFDYVKTNDSTANNRLGELAADEFNMPSSNQTRPSKANAETAVVRWTQATFVFSHDESGEKARKAQQILAEQLSAILKAPSQVKAYVKAQRTSVRYCTVILQPASGVGEDIVIARANAYARERARALVKKLRAAAPSVPLSFLTRFELQKPELFGIDFTIPTLNIFVEER
jgi:hypothetical protein